MSSALAIPTVTEMDLLNFHLKTFGRPFEAVNSEYDDGYDGYDNEHDEDDGLGYYPDGTKRTLTDEQVKMFRHSEIHRLLRERELARDAEEVEDGAEDTAKSGRSQKEEASSPTSPVDMGTPEGEGDESEYARFLEKEREEFTEAAAKRREKNRGSQNLNDRRISTRRRVREMDAANDVEPVLDY